MQATPLLSAQSSSGSAAGKRVLLAVFVLVLLLHAALLSGWFFGASGKPAQDAARATLIQFREVTPAPPTAAAPPEPSAAAAPSRSPAPRKAQATALESSPVMPSGSAAAFPEAAASTPATQPQLEEAVAAQAASEPALSAIAEPSITNVPDASAVQDWPGAESDAPIYRVALPPGFVQNYAVRVGPFSGTGVLSWAPAGGRYELSLIGNATVVSLAQLSRGRFDVTGLEPERFTSKTSGRAELAANFQRDNGIISFSGANRRFAWRQGAQDRLSVVIQLAAIVAAESSRLSEGQRFGVPVISERGDADVWTFRLVGWDMVSTPSGPLRAVKLTRELRKPNDRGLEIWMDESRHYMPLRLRIGNENDSSRMELVRE